MRYVTALVKHVEENIKRNLPKTMSDNKLSNILKKIFRTHLCKALVDCETLQEFDKNVFVFLWGTFHGWRVKGVCKVFQITEEYYQVHVIKGTVNACEINNGSKTNSVTTLLSLCQVIKTLAEL